MNQKTLEALQGSIAKWYEIEKGSGQDLGFLNCPLCQLFVKDCCRGCPVRESTGTPFCIGSPYTAFAELMREAWRRDGGVEPTSIDECSMDFEPRLKRLARDEIEFLEWLLPPGWEA